MTWRKLERSTQLQASVDQLQDANNELERSLKTEREQCLTVFYEKLTLRANVEAVRQQHNLRTAELEHERMIVARVARERDESDSALGRSTAELNNAHNRVKALEEENRKLKDDVTQAQEDLAAAVRGSREAALESLVKTLRDQLQSASSHADEYLKDRIKEVERANAVLLKEVEQGNADLERAKAAVKRAKADLEGERAKTEKERELRRQAQKSKELGLARDEAKRMAKMAEAARNEANRKAKRLEEAEGARQAAEKARVEAEGAARSAQAALAAAEAAAAEERARWDQLLGELAERAERAERQRGEAQALLDAILDRPGSDPELAALKGRVRSLEAQLAAEKEKQKQAAAGLSNSSSLPAAAASSDGPKIRALRNASRKLVQTIVKQLRPVGSKASKPIEIEVDRAAVVESALQSCLEQRLLEQLRQPAAPLKIAMECAEDRKGPSREFYALFFEELVKKQLVEEPMQRAPGVLPPASVSASAAPVPVVPAPAPAPAPQPRRKRTVIFDSEDEGESGEDGSSPQGENPKRVRLEGGQAAASGSGGGQRRSGRGQMSSNSKRANVVDRALLTKYRFIGAIIGRALLERILDPKGTDPIPAAFVPMIPMLSGKQRDACATAEEALALWQPFLDPQVHVSMARILAEPVSPEAPVPMDPYLQGCPAFSGEELTEANKRDLVRLAAQWQCVGRRQPLLEAMREGFQGVFTRPEASKKGPEAAAGAADALEAVGLLGADDWAALVGGEAWTAETLIANMRFHGDWRHFEEDRTLVERWLFDALRAGEVDPSQFARCIGRASAPASGKLERPLTIAPKTNTVKDGAGRRRAVLVPWSDKEWGLAFRTCFDEVEIPGVHVPSGAAGAEELEERRRLFVGAIRRSVDLALDFNDG
eukprot:tig00021012_g17026.t1